MKIVEDKNAFEDPAECRKYGYYLSTNHIGKGKRILFSSLKDYRNYLGQRRYFLEYRFERTSGTMVYGPFLRKV